MAGGTWLASSRDGRLAFVTNVREVQSLPQAKTRGDLPVLFLKVIFALFDAKSMTPYICLFKCRDGFFECFNFILTELGAR